MLGQIKINNFLTIGILRASEFYKYLWRIIYILVPKCSKCSYPFSPLRLSYRTSIFPNVLGKNCTKTYVFFCLINLLYLKSTFCKLMFFLNSVKFSSIISYLSSLSYPSVLYIQYFGNSYYIFIFSLIFFIMIICFGIIYGCHLPH